MAKVKLGLKELTPDELVALANTIKTAMTGNANFATPNPTLAAIGTMITNSQTGINDYNSAVAAAQTKLVLRDNYISVLTNGLSLLGAYVENASGGDAAKIESAAMGVRATPSPVGVPAQVLNLALTEGDFDGSLDGSWDRVFGANSYEVQTSVDPVSGTSWTFKMSSTKSFATIAGLTSGTKMWVRVRAVGAAGPGPWSDPAVKTVP
jgi:hypothetical protein